MNRTRSILLVVALAIMAVLSWWLFLQPKSEIQQPKQAVMSRKSDQVSETNHVTATGMPFSPQSGKSKTTEQLKKEYTSLNHRPIEFHGKAVDQYGDPVPDADVTCTVIIRTPLQEGVAKKMTKTGADGTFQLSGFKGESIGVAVRKNGYEQLANSGGFIYSLMYKNAHTPDPSKPVVLRMWKLAGPEPMIRQRRTYRIVGDGRTYSLNLVEDPDSSKSLRPFVYWRNAEEYRIKMLEGTGPSLEKSQTDLQISVHAPTEDSKNVRRPWSYILTVPEGGVVGLSGPFPYLAPEQGYQSEFIFMMDPTDPAWSDRPTKQFYLKSRGGKIYGRLALAVYAFSQNDTSFSVEYFLNPSGSRNLEFDPKKRLTKDEIAKLGAALNSD